MRLCCLLDQMHWGFLHRNGAIIHETEMNFNHYFCILTKKLLKLNKKQKVWYSFMHHNAYKQKVLYKNDTFPHEN